MRPLALYIGLRYTRAKRRRHFISFISLASMIGITLGVAVLITVLSVINGFDYEIRSRFFSVAPEVTVQAPTDIPLNVQNKINSLPSVVASAPFVLGIAMLSTDTGVTGIHVLGIQPEEEAKISKLSQTMESGHLNTLQPGQYNIILGHKLAEQIDLRVGDKVTLFVPQPINTPAGLYPRARRFTISGVFNTHAGFGFDTGLAYIDQTDAMKLFPQGEKGWHVKIKDIYQAPSVSKQLEQILPSSFLITDWTESYGSLFRALAMEKTMMFVILLLIVAVAAFNLVATLVMIVNDKQADIAILRTLGASPQTIMLIFIIQGAIVGLIGVIIGVVLGIILALNATALVNWLQHLFHMQIVKESVYFLNFLPSRLSGYDVVKVSLVAFGMAVLATIYPAIIAFRTQPAEALRYE